MKHRCSSYRVHYIPIKVEIEWEDPGSSAGWVDDVQSIAVASVSACTYETAICDHYIWVCREYYVDADDNSVNYADIGVYPRRVILSRKKL